MRNRWYIVGFYIVMGTALITLAVLQYHWLGSVSEAEKQRLEETLSASVENFVSDFTEVFQELSQGFRFHVTDMNEDITAQVVEALYSWRKNSPYADLLETVYMVRTAGQDSVEVFVYQPTEQQLTPVLQDSILSNWLETELANDGRLSSSLTLSSFPYLGEFSALSIPIQLLKVVQVAKENTSQKLNIELTVDQLGDVILLKLNNDYIKNELIPEIARRYFSESYADQYQLAVVKTGENETELYYSSFSGLPLPEPDIKTNLERLKFSNMFVLGDRFDSSPSFNIKKLENSDINLRSTHHENTEINDTQLTNRSEVWVFSSEFRDSRTIQETQHGSVTETDTTIIASFAGEVRSDSWELWLSVKDGSLDAFVAKTRNRNLFISFGILGILGISMILIVVFAQRSYQLAEQQMLFVAGVSHELRTPLSVIRSAAENLSEGVIQTEERKKQYAQLMLKEGRRLSDMVDQIMEFSGIQSGKRIYSFSEFQVGALCEEVIKEFQTVLETEHIHLEYSNVVSQKEVWADRDALFMSISNLLSNAIKFSGTCKKISLRVDEAPFKGKEGLRIRVQDFGIGIPPHEQHQVFKPFFRGHQPVQDQIKGNGIGLSLVQKVVQAHGGEVYLKSREGQGSTFILLIPYRHD